MIIDTHAHYDDEAFHEDREGLLESMEQHGIEKIINVGASLEGCEETARLAEKYDFVYGAIGVHPDHAGELNEDNLKRLKELCGREKIVAVGEIGLDYYWNKEEKEIQQYWFRRQLNMAREQKLPFSIHSRDAAEDTFHILEEEKAGEIGGVIHCFSYSKEMAEQYVKMGLYIGVGGVITFKNAKKLKQAVQAVPMDRILLETDCPYLSPEPNRGKRNSSINLIYVAEEIARLKNTDPAEVIERTKENAEKLFSL